MWKPRRVRLHFAGDSPSLEGVLTSRPPRDGDGFFRLEQVVAIVNETQEQKLEGVAWVPAKRVLFWQEVT